MAPRSRDEVAIWAIQDRRSKKVPRPWVVRWRVGGRQFSRAFASKTLAEELRAQLVVAHAEGKRFDRLKGMPLEWVASNITFADWVRKWFDDQRVTWKPNTRRSAAEALARAMQVFVHPNAPTPPSGCTPAAKKWLAKPGEYECPAHIAKWSLPLQAIDAAMCQSALAAMSLKLDGTTYAATVIARHRSVLDSLFAEAVEAGLMPANPWPRKRKGKRVAEKVDHKVEVAMLPSHDVAVGDIERLLNHQPASLRYMTFFSLIYWAGLRPGEALVLLIESIVLPTPEDPCAWGLIYVREAQSSEQELWLDEDEETGLPKTGPKRTVPIPPQLVAIIRKCRGDRATGYLIGDELGNLPTQSNLGRAWRRVRSSSSWRPYDLRHSAATNMINAGVPLAEAARRLGHSPEVLLKYYADVIRGDDEQSNARLEQWYRDRDAGDDCP